jgi:hypothetical protein
VFEEKTWKEVTTPNDRGACPIEGEVGKPDEAWRAQVLARLEDVEHWPQVEFIVFVQNIDLCSSRLGEHNAIIAGPGCTWTAQTIEELKENPCKCWYGDLPSQRLYPQWYISRANHFKAKEQERASTGSPQPDP